MSAESKILALANLSHISIRQIILLNGFPSRFDLHSPLLHCFSVLLQQLHQVSAKVSQTEFTEALDFDEAHISHEIFLRHPSGSGVQMRRTNCNWKVREVCQEGISQMGSHSSTNFVEHLPFGSEIEPTPRRLRGTLPMLGTHPIGNFPRIDWSLEPRA